MSINLSLFPLIWGEAGAREQFDRMLKQFIKSEFGTPAQTVRVKRGDDGIDAFVGDLKAGADVYQVKYFLGVGESQQGQIRRSFNRIRRSKRWKAKSWTLCLPVDLSPDEREWYEGWTGKQDGIVMRAPWGAMAIENLLIKYREIREQFFPQEYVANIDKNLGQLLHVIKERIPQRSERKLDVEVASIVHEGFRRRGESIEVELKIRFKVTNAGLAKIEDWAVDFNVSAAAPETNSRLTELRKPPRKVPILTGREENALGTFRFRVDQNPHPSEQLPKLLDVKITFNSIHEEGTGEKKSVMVKDTPDGPALVLWLRGQFTHFNRWAEDR